MQFLGFSLIVTVHIEPSIPLCLCIFKAYPWSLLHDNCGKFQEMPGYEAADSFVCAQWPTQLMIHCVWYEINHWVRGVEHLLGEGVWNPLQRGRKGCPTLWVVTTLTKAVWAVLWITLYPPGNFVDPPEFFGGIPHKCLTSQNCFNN